VLADSVEKARWQRDLLRFLHLRKRFVLLRRYKATAALKHAGGNLGAFFLLGHHLLERT